jgi:hypothetical protein
MTNQLLVVCFTSLSVKAEKTKYMLLSRHQNAGQNHDIKIANRYFENVAQLKYFGTTEKNVIFPRA